MAKEAVAETSELKDDDLDYDNETEQESNELGDALEEILGTEKEEEVEEAPPAPVLEEGVIAQFTVKIIEGQLPQVDMINWDKLSIGKIEKAMSYVFKAWKIERAKAVYADMEQQKKEKANAAE